MPSSSALRRIGAGVVAIALIATAAIVTIVLRHHAAAAPSCEVSVGADSYTLDIDQAANSTTIAAVGKRLGLPDHAVTVALAAALQESHLHNLPYGDRDSLGLFQQRPSQGWGTSAQILTPSYAADAFFHALTKVKDWETLAITDAAQEVQRSGAPTAYARWEPEARTLAIALTGEAQAGLSCRFSLARSQDPAPAVTPSMGTELGVSSLDAAFAPPQGWTIASWLVGHAQQFRVTTVSFANQEWRASTGHWRPATVTANRILFSQQPATT
jgi:hypothetical protein